MNILSYFSQGLLYESCVDFCQNKAMANDKGAAIGGRSSASSASESQIRFSQLLNDNQLSESGM